MLKKFKVKPILFITALFLNLCTEAQVNVSAGDLQLSLNPTGQFTSIKSIASGKNYLFTDTLAPLLTLVTANIKSLPSSLVYNKKLSRLTLAFKPVGVTIDIKVSSKPTHLVLEIIKAEPEAKIDAIIWGPFPTTIKKTVGEVIGVVRDGEIALGMQVLNINTLGGDLPNNEGSTWERGIAAKTTPWGSTLQAYSINRNKLRFVDAWGGQFENMPVPPIPGETVMGSKIALFICAEPKTLDILERIELDEKLPHPTINGVWFKRSPQFGRSYLISSFGEKDIDEMIGYTRRAGLMSLYHEGPFKSWGHFVLDEAQFPLGRAGLKACVDKAKAAGLHFGIHTLTNFINTNDQYITPVPDERLSMTGSSKLVNSIDAQQKTIEVFSPEYFNELTNNNLHTIKIGKELIRYKDISATPPYILMDCQRGSFGTAASAHQAGALVGKLLDHSYKVFFPNLDMQREVAKNLADLMNETGVDHLDFDGHEGGLGSGQGDYAVELFANDVYKQVNHEFICGTSISKTFYWHQGSYYNWGEPWYGGFKESMQQYRIDNQGLFDRNYMPHMLGWYLLGEHTTLAEMEWMLARAAGYNAGFAMVARPKALRSNPLSPVLLDAIREWENARTTQAFTPAQQELLKNPANEFHLEKTEEGTWNFYQYTLSPVFIREKLERQPGEPTHTTWEYRQDWPSQALQFRINLTGKEGLVKNFKLQIDQYIELQIPVSLSAGESLVCDGTKMIRIYDKDGKPKQTYDLAGDPPVIQSGGHKIIVNSEFEGDETPKVELRFKGREKKDSIHSRK
ncbi:MAG: hypothetical protein SH818_09395 [Saprospiraceae bacterium]|nr:hypothetical protein [Saprospiraceae bacterium]